MNSQQRRSYTSLREGLCDLDRTGHHRSGGASAQRVCVGGIADLGRHQRARANWSIAGAQRSRRCGDDLGVRSARLGAIAVLTRDEVLTVTESRQTRRNGKKECGGKLHLAQQDNF